MTRVIFENGVLASGLYIKENVGPFATEAKLENLFITIDQGKKFKDFRDDENPQWLINTKVTIIGPILDEEGKTQGTRVLITGDRVICRSYHSGDLCCDCPEEVGNVVYDEASDE